MAHQLKTYIMAGVLVGFSAISYANTKQEDREALYSIAFNAFMDNCFSSDSLIYGQHKRRILNNNYPIIFDTPQFSTTISVTTTSLEVFNIGGLFASLKLANQQEQAKCSLTLEGLDYQDTSFIDNLLEENYGLYLQNIGQDATHKYWQYLYPGRDFSIVSLYPADNQNKSKVLELARHFDILPVRDDAPFHEEDIQTYMRSEDHLAAFSLHLFATSPHWLLWEKQIARLPLITKAEGKNMDSPKLYLVSRKPKFEVRLIKGKNINQVMILLNSKEYDADKLKEVYSKRLPLFFDSLEELESNEKQYAAWRGYRNNIYQDISIEKQEDIQQVTLVFSMASVK